MIPEPANRSVLVLMGGPDAERAVSMKSGRAVATALRVSGRFEVIEQVINQPDALQLQDFDGDVVFPVLHGRWGEGGGLQRELERLGKPYVGSEPEAAAAAMDKLVTKRLVSSLGMATPPACALTPGDACDLDPPVVLKPVDDGSSVDLRICKSEQEITRAQAELHTRRPRLMAERYVHGRELTVGIVAGRTMPLIEIIPAVDFYDYEAKYTRDDTQYLLEPDLSEKISEEANRNSLQVFEQLGCRDLARVDFRLDENEQLWFLELNTMPGFTDHSLVPMAATRLGISMPTLCERLVEAALNRSQFNFAPPFSSSPHGQAATEKRSTTAEHRATQGK